MRNRFRSLVSFIIFFVTAAASSGTPLRAHPQSGTRTQPNSRAAASLPEILTNDNRTPAGQLKNGLLTLRLEAVTGLWYPEGKTGPARTVQVFAEEGRPPQIPGPLVRVPEGTEIAVTIRSAIAGSPLKVYGMMTRPKDPDMSIAVPPAETRQLRFKAGAPGTYLYWGTTTDAALNRRQLIDSQLTGAFIVDPVGSSERGEDRIFVITEWLDLKPPIRFSAAINGASWPFTERLTLPFGQPATWRVINGSFGVHPMHLHGTFYTVESRGDTGQDATFGPAGRRLVTTELLESGTTMVMRWVPDRVGNWLFHCHILAHVSGDMRLGDKPPGERTESTHHAEHDIERAMAGLVLGIKVLPGDETAAPDLEPHVVRPLKLLMKLTPNRYGSEPGYGFAIVDPAAPPAVPGPPMARAPSRGADGPGSAAPSPSPTLVLTKGEPVVITLVNELKDETSIHWHGIELESYYDGVPGWTGDSTRITPPVLAGGNFEVRFTPPRTGTFIYHTHGHDRTQLSSGLYGALVVLEPGQKHDPEVDLVVLLGSAGPRSPVVEVNRSTNPPPMNLRVGVKYRFRFINITTNFNVAISLRTETAAVQWKAVAKDGPELPPSQATMRSARQVIGVGETYDFEFEPTTPGDLRLEVVRTGSQAYVTSQVVRVAR